MDSQDNILEQEVKEEVIQEATAPEVETPAAAETEAPAESAEAPAESAEAPIEDTEAPVEEAQAPVEEAQAPAQEEQPQKVYETKKEVIDRIKDIAHGDEPLQKEEIDYLKTVFYKLHFAEREANLKAYLDAGGDPDAYQITPDEDEEVFKAEMGIIKEKRAKLFKEQEAEKQENLEKKLAIIEKIKGMITSPEEANKAYQEFKALQAEWKEIKNVPAEKASELWRNYQLYVEQFYDLLKLNSEAREYDFKKNLELKTKLCEAAERLADETDVISAFHQLQKLHAEYREIGPVNKDLREEIWNRFKAASTVINKRHQQHFEGIRAKEEDNLARKTALCEKVEAIAAEENKGSSDWEKHTKGSSSVSVLPATTSLVARPSISRVSKIPSRRTPRRSAPSSRKPRLCKTLPTGSQQATNSSPSKKSGRPSVWCPRNLVTNSGRSSLVPATSSSRPAMLLVQVSVAKSKPTSKRSVMSSRS